MEQHKKYQLAPTINLPLASEFDFSGFSESPETIALQKEENYVMEWGFDYYIINPTIRNFLVFFQLPRSLSETIVHFAQVAQCDQKLITPTIEDFFESMRKRRILISENRAAKEQQQTESRLEKNQRIGHYQIEAKIFNNKKIEIYKAKNLQNQQAVAIKILKADQCKKQRRIQSFAQEFSILKEIGAHPNICQLVEYVEEEDMIFGVLEFVDGLPLRQYIKKQQPSLKNKLKILYQFLKGMAYIHQKLMVHGDLHMSNLLVQENADLKIIDFNMSNRKVLQKEEIVREGGVHQYIPPEKIDAGAFKMVNGPASFTSEVFQMGVIVYYLLYEQMPFKGFSWQSLAKDIQHREPTFYESTPKGEIINPAILKLLQKMLHKLPRQRFKSAISILRKYEDLLKTRKHDYIHSSRSTTAYQ